MIHRRWNYFVAYKYPGGYGRCNIYRDAPIKSIEDIAEVERCMEEQQPETPGQILIQSYQLFKVKLKWRSSN